jgi:glycosyltransferase involved in cell wall biosynthesis
MTETIANDGVAETAGVSLIATVYNEADNIGRFAASVRAQTRQPDEIVIVDGGSTDGTPEIVRAELGDAVPLRVIVAPGLNISEGRNRAIREASRGIIACADAGCVMRDDWLKKIVAPLERDPAIGVASGFYAMDSKTLLQQCVGLATMPGQLDPVDPETFLPSSRSVAFRKSAWAAADGYPEWLYTGEDTLFDLKLKALGVGFEFVGDAIVQWAPRPTWRSVYRQFYLYGRGGGHLGNCRDCLLWVAKRAVAVTAIGVAGAFIWPLWLLLPALLIYDHLFLVHPLARRVAKRIGGFKAYVVTSAALWLIRVARTWGYLWGSIQRWTNRERYVDSLRQYMDSANE